MITAIILAAGRSQRMGTQKLLLPLGGKTVIAGIVDEIIASPVDEILVVVRPDGEDFRQALTERPLQFVFNPDAHGDMLSSVRCGLAAVAEACQSALIVLGDQPGISRTIIADLIRAQQRSGKRIAMPICKGQRGHPLLVSLVYRDEILRAHDQVGLRGLVQAHSDDVVTLEVAPPAVLEDMDVPDDYQQILARSKQHTTARGE